MTTRIPAFAHKKALMVMEHIANGYSSTKDTDLLFCSQLAREVLDSCKRKKAPAKTLPGKSLAEKREEKKAANAIAVELLYGSAAERAGGKCELCGDAFSLSLGVAAAPELHHLEGGSGRRRQEQRMANVMLVHGDCHRSYHRHPETYIVYVRGWCAKYRYPLPRSVARRDGA